MQQLTCSIAEASKITGLSDEYLRACSKDQNPKTRLPGFRTGTTNYRVIVSALDGWLRRKANLDALEKGDVN